MTKVTSTRRSGDFNGKHYVKWECKCKCGNVISARRSNLLSGNTNSCGCYKKKRMRDAKKLNKYNLIDYSYGVGMDSVGRFFFFDKNDFPKIKERCWKVGDKEHDCRVYTRTMVGDESKIVLLHRFLYDLTPKDSALVDHKHGNPNDNRRKNLRLSNKMKNTWNKTKLMKTNTSGYTGVSWSTVMNAWCAEIKTNGVKTVLGYYNTPEEAFEVRKRAELLQRGEISYVSSDKNDGYFNPNTINYDPSTFKTVEEAEKDYEQLIREKDFAV